MTQEFDLSRKYYVLDVFTERPLTGNPLAVVLDSEGLDDASMQKIAKEFNLSETVFVSSGTANENTAALRIFTPAHELPFAGHPTIGTAILLSHLNHLVEGDEFTLEEKVGPVKCTISHSSKQKTARFALPKNAERVAWAFDRCVIAEALGLKPDQIGSSADDISLWDGGVPYTLVKLNSKDAVAAVKINPSILADAEPVINAIAANMYVYCEGGEAYDTDFHARMFAPLSGIWEDPATGSAVASLSGLLASLMNKNEKRRFKIEQGYEMGRPSQIFLDLETGNGDVVNAGISGSAVIVGDGNLHL